MLNASEINGYKTLSLNTKTLLVKVSTSSVERFLLTAPFKATQDAQTKIIHILKLSTSKIRKEAERSLCQHAKPAPVAFFIKTKRI